MCPGRDRVVRMFPVLGNVRTELWGHFYVPTMSLGPPPIMSMAQPACCSHNYGTSVYMYMGVSGHEWACAGKGQKVMSCYMYLKLMAL